MKYLIALVTAISISSGVLAGEVGALNPQLARTASANLAIALADTGTSVSWVKQSFELEASAHSIAILNNRNKQMFTELNTDLSEQINRKFMLSVRD